MGLDPVPESVADSGYAESRSKPRILVANQDSFSRIYFKRAISRCVKAEVCEAENGVEALELLSNKPFEVLLLDLDMPVLSGLEVLEFIHDDPLQKRLQVLVTTGVSGEESVRKAIALGVNDYLLKPYQQSTVEERLTRALARSRRLLDKEATVVPQLKPRILVADRDHNFCSTVESVLSVLCEVRSAHSIPDVLTASLRWKPQFVWIHPQVAGQRADFVLQKLGSIRREDEMSVYLVTDGAPASATPPPFCKGWIEKSFVPEVITKRFQEILDSSDITSCDTKNSFDQIQPDIISAVLQVFGMMTGSEAKSAASAAQEPMDVSMSLSLSEQSKSLKVHAVLAASRPLAAALYAQLTGGEGDEVDEEFIDSVLGEMMNMIAGRIKTCYEPLGLNLQVGLPNRNESFTPLPIGQFSKTHWFQWEIFPPFSLAVVQAAVE
jgi:CheY-like chemotaxis protein/CheY-specific phosphatase CheX